MKKINPDELALFGANQLLKSTMDDMPSLDRPTAGKGSDQAKPSRNRASTSQRKKESTPARKRASTLADATNTSDDLASNIAATLKQPGDKPAFIRITPAERRALKTVLHHYEMQDVKLSETDLGRIALTALIEDFNTNREKSLLARVIYKMNTA